MAPSNRTNLDFLRAVAVLAVLGDHLIEYFGVRTGLVSHPWDWRLGRWGVLLFFVHTSLVLMWSLERLHASGGHLYTKFTIRRAFRIFPLSVLAVVFVVTFRVPALGWSPTFESPSVSKLLTNLSLTQNLFYEGNILGPMWSLPLELQMYLVLPVLFWALRFRSSLPWVLGMWVAAVVVALVQPHLIGRANVAQFAPCFVGGIVAYVLTSRTNARLPSWSWPLALGGLTLAYMGAAALSGEIHPLLVAWLACLSLGVMIPHFRDLSHPALCRTSELVARYSYGIYLSHIVLIWFAFIQLTSLPWWAQAGVFTFLMVLVPVVLYHWVEEPFIRLGSHVARTVGTAGLPATLKIWVLALMRRPRLAPVAAESIHRASLNAVGADPHRAVTRPRATAPLGKGVESRTR